MPTPGNPTRRFGQEPPEEKVWLKPSPDGFKLSQVMDHRGFWRIECNCPTFHKAKQGLAKWCDHAQELVKAHNDVEEPRVLDPNIRVTVIINPALEAWFQLDNADENGFRYVWLVVPDESSPAAATRFFHKKPMGLIHVSSGRLELRTLMLEFLIGLTAEGLSCRASHHAEGKSPYENMSEHMTSRGNPGFHVLVDVFDLYTTGNCRSCNEAFDIEI